MTENDIKGYVAAMRGASEARDYETRSKAETALLEIALLDLHRIADALTALAKIEVHRVTGSKLDL